MASNLSPAARGRGYVFTAADWLHWGFFASHIPITLFMDAQAILPRSMVPRWVRYDVPECKAGGKRGEAEGLQGHTAQA